MGVQVEDALVALPAGPLVALFLVHAPASCPACALFPLMSFLVFCLRAFVGLQGLPLSRSPPPPPSLSLLFSPSPSLSSYLSRLVSAHALLPWLHAFT